MLGSDATLRITEIFCSIQGESSLAGERTVFVRLTGCPLRCTYCDTAYAFQGGEIMSLADILQRVDSFNAPYVCVTGGEPLAQPGCLALLVQLCDRGYSVSLETSGAMDISDVDARVKRIVDLKTPSSKEMDKNRLQDIACLNQRDEVKVVICDRDDYLWAKDLLQQYQLTDRVGNVLFSPAFAIEENASPSLSPTQLAEWILQDQLAVRFQLQLHKLLWNDEPGH